LFIIETLLEVEARPTPATLLLW